MLGAAAALGVDALIGPSSFSVASGLALLGAVFGSVVTVGAFSFWMRPLATQLAASTVPPRLMTARLHDRFQRRVVGATVGVLAYVATVILRVPAGAGGAPLVSTAIGAALGVAAIASLLVAMQHAERSTRPSVVVAEVATDLMDHIRRTALDEPVEPVELPDGRSPARIVAPSSGWLRQVDDDGLLADLPEGATVRLDAGVGSFVIAGWTTVASVWPSDAVAAGGPELGSHFRIGEQRGGPLDLVGRMTLFADLGVHAATGAASASTAYESLWWLGAVLHELVRHRDVGLPDVHLEDGRTLVHAQRLSTAELCDLAVDRIRQATASQPELALELVRVVLDARLAAEEAGHAELAETLRRHADLVVEQCRHSGGLPSDIDRVVQARRRVDDLDSASGRSEEYQTAARDGGR